MTDPNQLSADDEWTTQRLQELLDNQTPEDFRLDYKSAGALPLPVMKSELKDLKRMEIGKDSTAFANSNGGVIIYGIKEGKSSDGRPIPTEFDPISLAEVSRDQLTQIIAAHSEPTLVGVRIIPVPIPGENAPAKVSFVVVIPASDTAHMASDGCYYFRNEATTSKMRDWQVRDAMNRRKHPSIIARVEIFPQREFGQYTLHISLQNVGIVIARQFCFEVLFPTHLNGVAVELPRESLADFYMAETENGEAAYFWRTSNQADSPLFPGQRFRANLSFQVIGATIEYLDNPKPSATIVSVRVFADEMPPLTIEIPAQLPRSSSAK